jgi:hypothetical protein
MKVTLLEILAFTAVLFLFATLNHQVLDLRSETAEKETQLAELRSILSETRAQVQSREEDSGFAVGAMSTIEKKLEDLTGRVAQVSNQVTSRDQLDDRATRAATEVSKTRDAILADVTEARQLLAAESRRLDARAQMIETAVQNQGSTLEHLKSALKRDIGSMTKSMLAPTVQLNGDETVGSGTLIFSGRAKAGEGYESYALTSYHVIRNILNDPGHRKDRGIAVSIYGGARVREDFADMVLFNERIDTALLKLRGTELCTAVARLAPPEMAQDVAVFTGIYAVGCPLGNDPIPTGGFISSLRNEVGGSNYWMINAPTYFGNSGGGIFLESTHELIAVFSKIYTHGKGKPVVITHMGLATPIHAITDWMVAEKYGWLLGPRPEAVAGAISSRIEMESSATKK